MWDRVISTVAGLGQQRQQLREPGRIVANRSRVTTPPSPSTTAMS
jgi:hypothetical protein